ncbi:SUMF1/EgtB/PvdO family nonheme iron enzyme [Sorangium sp. So ce834]|uniref:formylglycine-generating enzyme family protein n=1 Tax=Sorangium sp. So ce834 TaxID=3133321 RepID=UPI003F5E0F46
MVEPRRALSSLAVLSMAVHSGSCGGRERPQLLVVVDTDAPVAAQLLADPSISPEAVVDTVRIDRFDDAWRPSCIDDVDCTANFVLPDPSSWPFSFGVATPEAGGAVLRLRVRAFRGAVATRGKDAVEGRAFSTIDPPPEAAIDRLLEVALPSSGVETVELVLSADCLGVPVSLRDPPRTCLDGSRRAAAPTEGVLVGPETEAPATRAGTWPRAREVPCGAAPPGADAVCIPGGLGFLGQAELAAIDEQSDAAAAPPRPVYVSPFFMDRTEFTVGRFRDLLNEGLLGAAGELPSGPDPDRDALAGCRWLGAVDGANDDHPLNCLSWKLAREACRASGGDLPTEAQWEHAARGRGQGRVYPWGDASPACCTASAGRGTLCPGGTGPEEVGAHPPSAACGGLGDASRDGVLDLGGNLSELCADRLVPYGEGCWGAPGIFVDPRCDDDTTRSRAARGGDWASGPANTRAAFRRGDVLDALHGFRCVYAGGAP